MASPAEEISTKGAVFNQLKESIMDEDLELIDLGDAKETTKGWGAPTPKEEEPSLPFRED